MEQAHQGLSHALTQIPDSDILHRADWTPLDDTRALIARRLVQPTQTVELEVEVLLFYH